MTDSGVGGVMNQNIDWMDFRKVFLGCWGDLRVGEPASLIKGSTRSIVGVINVHKGH